MAAYALLRYARVSPRKARLVAEAIEGRRAEYAVALLENIPQKAATILRKVLRSAIFNATQDVSVDVDNLVVSQVRVDNGPMSKRFRPMSMGRAGKIRKRTSHIRVELAEG